MSSERKRLSRTFIAAIDEEMQYYYKQEDGTDEIKRICCNRGIYTIHYKYVIKECKKTNPVVFILLFKMVRYKLDSDDGLHHIAW